MVKAVTPIMTFTDSTSPGTGNNTNGNDGSGPAPKTAIPTRKSNRRSARSAAKTTGECVTNYVGAYCIPFLHSIIHIFKFLIIRVIYFVCIN